MTEDQRKRKQEYMAQWRAENKEYMREYEKKKYYDDVEASRAKSRQWRKENYDKALEIGKKSDAKRRSRHSLYTKEWREHNKERCKAQRRNRYNKHRESELKANSKYCKNNAARINRNQARRYEKNPERFKKRVKAWQKANPDKVKLILKACRTRRKKANGKTTPTQLQARIDYYGGCCAYCGAEFQHVDHVIAIALGGTAWPANLRPACSKCNLKKKAKPWRVWFSEIGLAL